MKYLLWGQEMLVGCQAVQGNCVKSTDNDRIIQVTNLEREEGLVLPTLLLCVPGLFVQGNLNGTKGLDSDFSWCIGLVNQALSF